MPEQIHTGTSNAVWGGIVLSIIGNINLQDLVQTVLLAMVGTIVSFCMSVLLKKLCKRFNKP